VQTHLPCQGKPRPKKKPRLGEKSQGEIVSEDPKLQSVAGGGDGKTLKARNKKNSSHGPSIKESWGKKNMSPTPLGFPGPVHNQTGEKRAEGSSSKTKKKKRRLGGEILWTKGFVCNL